MNASLNEKLRAVKWGEFKLGDLFEVVSYKKCFDANKVAIIENRGHPYIVRQSTENGRKGNIDEPIKYLNPGNTISFGQDTSLLKKRMASRNPQTSQSPAISKVTLEESY